MKIFISGGCKNGKSYFAQYLAEAQRIVLLPKSLYYIATMKPADEEDKERIARHKRERRGSGYTTIEQPTDIEDILHKSTPGGSFLIDSLTALLANEMFLSEGVINEHAADKIIDGLKQISYKRFDVVFVSDYIYCDAQTYDPLTEKYRKALAQIDCAAAKMCDIVIEVMYTNIIVHKGMEALEKVVQDGRRKILP